MWPFRAKQSAVALPVAPVPTTNFLSFVAPREVSSLGELPGEAIAALVEGPMPSGSAQVVPDAVRPNRVFIDFMHEVIRARAPSDPDLRAAAAAQWDGWVYVIDLRTPDGPQGRVPAEDIIGGFQVAHGEILADTYVPNEKHKVYTSNGLVRLPPLLRAAFVEELKRCKPGR